MEQSEQKIVNQDERWLEIVKSWEKIKSVCESGHTNPDLQNMLKIFPALLKLQHQKSEVYGRSYCRHGELSIFFNTERKWDRLLNIMEKAMKSNNFSNLHSEGTATETFFDTLVDLASYSLLWIGYIVEQDPTTLEKFISANKLDV